MIITHSFISHEASSLRSINSLLNVQARAQFHAVRDFLHILAVAKCPLCLCSHPRVQRSTIYVFAVMLRQLL
jgi:hypothetical protein